MKKFNDICELEKLLEEKSDLLNSLTSLLEKVIQSKNHSLYETDLTSPELYLDLGVVKSISEEKYQLVYDSQIVQYASLKFAEDLLEREFPDNLRDADQFCDDFRNEIRKPKTNHIWENGLSMRLEDFGYLYLSEKHDLDMVDALMKLPANFKEREAHLLNFEVHFCNILPYLSLTASEIYKVIKHLQQTDSWKGSVFSSINRIWSANISLANALLKLLKEEKEYEMLGFFLGGMYQHKPDEAFAEASWLLEESQPHGLHALAWFDYKGEPSIKQAMQLLAGLELRDVKSLQKLPIFYSRIIANASSSEEDKKNSFNFLYGLASLDVEDEFLREELVFRVKMIQGYDVEKVKLLSLFMKWKNANFIKGFFTHFTDPKYLFELIKEAYLANGAYVNFDLFKDDLHVQQRRNPQRFKQELVKLLGDNNQALAFAGIKIILSKHNGVYNVDLTTLDQNGQESVLAAIANYPVQFDRLLPFLLQLRKSSFEEVKRDLQKELIELIPAYGSELLNMIKSELDAVSSEEDSQLLAQLQEGAESYEAIQKRKEDINELNPTLNDINLIEKYYQLEQEHQTEMMEDAQKNSMMRQIAKNVMILRGSGFKSEGNDTISMLGTFRAEQIIDSRYFLDPDQYNWNFQQFLSPATVNPEK